MFLIFTLCDFCGPIKDGFLNVSLFSADMNCFYFNTFYSVLMFSYFYKITNFHSQFHHYYYGYFCYCCFVIVIAIIISSFSMLLTFIFLVFTILFYLCIYRIFLNFKQMTWPKHCSKLALKVLRLYQCLWWELWTLFA